MITMAMNHRKKNKFALIKQPFITFGELGLWSCTLENYKYKNVYRLKLIIKYHYFSVNHIFKYFTSFNKNV